ncbi:Uncharacterized protein dnm_024980 [Desulfonema magnum]|uniref:Uncharacterized protein n=1 Tax=Desulfonema magnum TaxID=45655 RepID=A0A975GMB3_9BACT|nr:Uncharacterized protein dnm_024980 [Desulfonema magnum]
MALRIIYITRLSENVQLQNTAVFLFTLFFNTIRLILS